MPRPSRLIAAFAITVALAAGAHAQSRQELVALGIDLFASDLATRSRALAALLARGDPDAAPAIILSMRFPGADPALLVSGLQELTGEALGPDWGDWMLWQQAHPEIEAFDGFAEVHATVHALIDPNFQLFVYPGVAHEIRIEEIVWGGVRKDGIPALTNPRLVAADAAAYLDDDNLVFGVEINGDARAYPLRILNWHEMFNDVVGGVPVSLAYCTLCGSGILYETSVEGFPYPLVFGSSGFLYRSNKLMYDTYTHSLWNQFTGRPVVGTLTGSGIELNTRPVVITSWGTWRAAHPDTRVLDITTGYQRDYAEGAAYGAYFASPDLMFPALVDETDLRQKDYVFVLRGAPVEKSWPLARFAGGAVINDTAGALHLTLIGDAATRTVRAYRTGGEPFAPGATPGEVRLGEVAYQVTEDALVGPEGERFERLAGHIAYWFAWSGYYGDVGEVALD